VFEGRVAHIVARDGLFGLAVLLVLLVLALPVRRELRVLKLQI
jgi:hypothetical protein